MCLGIVLLCFFVFFLVIGALVWWKFGSQLKQAWSMYRAMKGLKNNFGDLVDTMEYQKQKR